MASIPFFAPTVANAVPVVFWAGVLQTAPVDLQLVQNSGKIRLILGIDVYPINQPANGAIDLSYEDHVYFPTSVSVFSVQQSQNFPGPFQWRGLFPIYDTAALLQWTGSVPFNFLIWGVRVPDWQTDLGQDVF